MTARDDQKEKRREEILRAGLDLTRHFFQRHVWEARGIVPPATRDGFLAALARALEAEDRDAR